MNIQVIDLSSPLWLQALEKLRHDFYHLPEYVALESRRVSAIPEAILIVEDEKILFVPYLVRQCNDVFDLDLTMPEVFDVMSPYGYCGILLSQAAANTPEFVEVAGLSLFLGWRFDVGVLVDRVELSALDGVGKDLEGLLNTFEEGIILCTARSSALVWVVLQDLLTMSTLDLLFSCFVAVFA